MVKLHGILIFLFLAFLPLNLPALDVKVDANINPFNIQARQALTGTIAITHNLNDKIDEKSFLLENKPLPVEFLQETKFSPNNPLVMSTYRFKIDGKPKGLYILPPVKVTVGGKVYESLPSTYEVGETSVPSTKAAAPKTSASSSSGKILRLEAIVQGPAEIFPGQRLKVVYRYTFNDNVELTKEDLPLLQAEGFLKVGAPDVKDENQGDVSLHEVSQVLEAVKPGDYKFEASHIEGYVYRADPFGSRVYIKPSLQADAPAITITVLPFPAKDKPASFNGAIGPFSAFEARLQSPDHLNVGDKMILELDLTGTGQLEHAPLPPLCCLPGFSGVFSQSDIPPKEDIKGPVKTFLVEMRPLTAHISNIPEIEYAYFNPETKGYGTLKSKPIPIVVTALPQQQAPTKKEEAAPPPEWKQFPKTPQPIEIHGNKPLVVSDLQNYTFGQWWVLILLPLALFALILQLLLRKHWREYKPAVRAKTSDLYLSEALKANPASNTYYHLLNKALILKLVEKGILKDPKTTPENLPTEGVAGEVRDLLMKIEEKRFTGQDALKDPQLSEKVKALYNKIIVQKDNKRDAK